MKTSGGRLAVAGQRRALAVEIPEPVNGYQTPLLALIATTIVVAGVLADTVSSTLGVIALVTGLSAAAAREAAVLAHWPEAAVRRATAVGFFVGFFASRGLGPRRAHRRLTLDLMSGSLRSGVLGLALMLALAFPAVVLLNVADATESLALAVVATIAVVGGAFIGWLEGRPG